MEELKELYESYSWLLTQSNWCWYNGRKEDVLFYENEAKLVLNKIRKLKQEKERGV